MRPLFNWPESKEDFTQEIISEFPIVFDTYYEPFFGSGSVYWDLLNRKRVFNGVVLGDSRRDLMNCYATVKDDPERLSKIVELCIRKHSPEYMNEMSKQMMNPSVFFYMMIALNRRAVNKNLRFKLGYDLERIEKASGYLNRCKAMLECSDWERTTSKAGQKDVVYFDPPSLKSENFETGGFNKSNHVWLNNYAKQLRNKGARVFLTNCLSTASLSVYGEPKRKLSPEYGLWVY